MVEVFKIIHNYYDTGASVKLNFNPVGSKSLLEEINLNCERTCRYKEIFCLLLGC